MKIKLITAALSVACATVVLSIGDPAFAQATAQQATSAVTRAQVKAERDEFLKTHEWFDDQWQLKGADKAKKPAGGPTRAQVKAERDAFLSKNRWDTVNEVWAPIQGAPRDVSKLSRDEVKREAAEFHRTHEWDEANVRYKLRGRPLPAK